MVSLLQKHTSTAIGAIVLSGIILPFLSSCDSSESTDYTDLVTAVYLSETKFTNLGDGTVKDVDGRIWMKCSVGQEWNASIDNCTGNTTGGPTTYGAVSPVWCELADLCFDLTTGLADSGPAFDACAESTVAGYTDWRLPTIYELDLIADNVTYSSFIAAFPETPDDKPFWSGTNDTDSDGGTSSAMGTWFRDSAFGDEVSRVKETSNLYVRCVRDP